MHGADPINLFVVVETGDHHVTILDGDTFEPLCALPDALRAARRPEVQPDGRFVYFMSRDGWVSKYDLWTLTTLAEIRAGINSRNIARLARRQHIAVANYLPHTLVILSSATCRSRRSSKPRTGRAILARVGRLHAPPAQTFIVALKDVPEIWEIATEPNAPPVYSGLVHSHEQGMIEALPSSQGLFALRRIEIPEPLDDFFFDPRLPQSHRLGARGQGRQVVNLNVGRKISELDWRACRTSAPASAWSWNGRPVMATPHLHEGRISVHRHAGLAVVKRIDTPGPGFFMRSHENTPYAWTDSMLGKARTRWRSSTSAASRSSALDARRRARPPRMSSSTRRPLCAGLHRGEGRRAGVYDAATFAEVKRIPMSRPSGKYNVWNKITFSDGTSH